MEKKEMLNRQEIRMIWEEIMKILIGSLIKGPPLVIGQEEAQPDLFSILVLIVPKDIMNFQKAKKFGRIMKTDGRYLSKKQMQIPIISKLLMYLGHQMLNT
jgi:hypothetical protein